MTEAEIIALFTTPTQNPTSVVGVGDDCAVLAASDSQTVVTTDAMNEGVHFLRDRIAPEDLGYKCIATNLSDIAAMGALPTQILLSLALPADIDPEWLRRFADGCKEHCHTHRIDIVGGNTSRSDRGMFVSITAIGHAPSSNLKFRNAAKEGDVIFVSRNIGDSAAGLALLLNHKDAPYEHELIQSHVRPSPEGLLGQWFGTQSGVHALMDLSDGLMSDLPKIVAASQCGAEIMLENIPVSDSLREFCKQQNYDVSHFAAAGGEDYALLGTCDTGHWAVLQRDCQKTFGRPLFSIGKITSNVNTIQWLQNGKMIQPTVKPFSHF